jgi:hypothetical protein
MICVYLVDKMQFHDKEIDLASRLQQTMLKTDIPQFDSIHQFLYRGIAFYQLTFGSLDNYIQTLLQPLVTHLMYTDWCDFSCCSKSEWRLF